MKNHYKSIETKLIHSGEPMPRVDGALVQPIYQSATYEFTGSEGYHDIKYIRLNNSPNHHALNEKLAALENAETAMVCASGMAAISTALFGFLKSGDHLMCHKSLYGGTNGLVTHDFPQYGIEYSFFDASDPSTWQQHLKKNTKVIYVETITNPTLEVADLKAVVEFARKNNLVSMIDNTFASPFNFRPAELGFDISLHSATKFLNGHSDVVAGVIITTNKIMETLIPLLNHLGSCLDPHTIFLLQRGVKTLALRMRQQNESAQKIAEFLSQHKGVQEIKYPGLKSHPHHARAAELLDGFGGMLCFDPVGGQKRAKEICAKLNLATEAPSLGGIETLVSIPAIVSHAGLTAEERERSGLSESLIRVSVGIENTADLIDDFKQALE